MTNQDYMKRALELAKKAMGYTSPNPMVGCVVVKDGRIGLYRRWGIAPRPEDFFYSRFL